MFAIIRSGAKQYKVTEGQELDVELLDLEPGQKTTITDVLLVANGSDVKVGKPNVAGASVECEVVDLVKADKVVAFKFRRRKGYHRKVGHRQKLNRIKVTKITA